MYLPESFIGSLIGIPYPFPQEPKRIREGHSFQGFEFRGRLHRSQLLSYCRIWYADWASLKFPHAALDTSHFLSCLLRNVGI